MSAPYWFRAMWPIVADLPASDLFREARCDLPLLAAQAHARIIGPGRFSFARSVDVPGSGRVSEFVLIFEAPAVERRRGLRSVAA